MDSAWSGTMSRFDHLPALLQDQPLDLVAGEVLALARRPLVAHRKDADTKTHGSITSITSPFFTSPPLITRAKMPSLGMMQSPAW